MFNVVQTLVFQTLSNNATIYVKKIRSPNGRGGGNEMKSIPEYTPLRFTCNFGLRVQVDCAVYTE